MQPQSDAEYKQLLTDVIKKQIVILGPDITLIKARNVAGLTVDNDGNVTAISGEPQQITQALIDQFVQLSGLIVKKTMEPLLMYHTTDTTPSLSQEVKTAPTTPQTIPSASAQPAVAPTANPEPVPSVTPPMPQGTQPIGSIDVSHSPMQVSTDPMPPETDMETQKIINEALQNT